MSKLAYSIAEAATATGYSTDVIRRAIKAGDLLASKPRVNGKELARPIIAADELDRWIRS